MNPLRRYRTRELILALTLTASAAGLGVAGFAPDIREALEPDNNWGTVTHHVPALLHPVGIAPTCAISRWGERPWLKPGAPKDDAWHARSMAALGVMRVPSDVSVEVLERIQRGQFDEEVLIGNTRVHGPHGDYHGWFASTYMPATGAPVVCSAARANFRDDERRERAKVYHVGGYSIMVPDACGNLSRIAPIATPALTPRTSPPLLPYAYRRLVPAPPPVAAPGPWPLPPGAVPIVPAPGSAVPTQNVPEPAGLFVTLAALGAAFIARKRK